MLQPLIDHFENFLPFEEQEKTALEASVILQIEKQDLYFLKAFGQIDGYASANAV